ncbi:hypothetical protein NEUTE1DRAFT_117623 [Neurospora tetrasperma FGSC 2508]|uniref:Uncharacterized protein n=1 Tax=Neurospora tetrasperma (strain FGSC 2508 / ATCC MYA-4615 / P0657) TaxID=510951 RepID=F8MRX7_NEUT8|nr:uncharacterized protein NEUTE1DRAFT_117623 [Neurospora tetrasperma FGSC 2508]EGO54971.1 hypothetical protein NEUTE1DRAFT_117623 [Neurospora tetrasperma FGSC 2508]EGZ69838.1 hypothetical protein NEUTE2DRAFT_145668 [Neurospora tetrasperma FGSC 2509]
MRTHKTKEPKRDKDRKGKEEDGKKKRENERKERPETSQMSMYSEFVKSERSWK